MGIAIYKIGSPTCNMHHIRNPNDTDFIYDPRTQPLEDGPVLRGRCGLTTFTTAEQKGRAEHLLSAFGRDETNIPEFGGEADARFMDKGDARPVGRLVQNSALRETMVALEGNFFSASIMGS
ncbi:uncharacterized protein BDW43DRAFT_312984 [Aspergillus alliaceus]|uniref:uncharacterized protein n=1 Tax=Petromyces alliaceus TaxID=209559 RepID=UPI0012A64932|nr:uncharacterized protein BDW43DRAFT_312984 [Aspergillus alliaceus]KAB8231463.1 hypothetical protein BDW43DRAFT_312984 [Aspergillus alliaceus]